MMNPEADLTPELWGDESGVMITVTLSGDGIYPKDLNWIGLKDATVWARALKAKTPLGQIYLDSRESKSELWQPHYIVNVVDLTGAQTTESGTDPQWVFPHELDMVSSNTKSISELQEFQRFETHRDRRTRARNREYYNLRCVYSIWNTEDILSPESPFVNPRRPTTMLDEDEKRLATEHSIR